MYLLEGTKSGSHNPAVVKVADTIVHLISTDNMDDDYIRQSVMSDLVKKVSHRVVFSRHSSDEGFIYTACVSRQGSEVPIAVVTVRHNPELSVSIRMVH